MKILSNSEYAEYKNLLLRAKKDDYRIAILIKELRYYKSSFRTAKFGLEMMENILGSKTIVIKYYRRFVEELKLNIKYQLF